MEKTNILENIRTYWEDSSAHFDKEHDTEHLDRWQETLQRLLEGNTKTSVLDLGTGTGFLANMTACMGHPTVGMDLSKAMLALAGKHAKESGSPAIFMQGNVLELPFEDESFDYIINSRLIWTLIEPDMALKEWMRVLKPGGQILCFNRMEEGRGIALFDPIYQDDTDTALPLKSASIEELLDLYRRNGLQNAALEKLTGLTREEFDDYDPWFVLKGTKPELPDWKKVTETIADFWDQTAAGYEQTHEMIHLDVWKQRLEEQIGSNRNIRILDLATGTGMLANMLGEMGYSTVGLDLSEGMMALARHHAQERNSGVAFVKGDVLDLPFEDESFDCIISCRLLWTLVEPQRALAEWKRVVKPGGWIIGINEIQPGKGIDVRANQIYREDIDSHLKLLCASEEELLRLFQNAGLGLVSLEYLPGCKTKENDFENWFALKGQVPIQ